MLRAIFSSEVCEAYAHSPYKFLLKFNFAPTKKIVNLEELVNTTNKFEK